MALHNKDANPVTDVQPKAKAGNENFLIPKGSAIIAGMTEEQRANLCSKSGTLHFVNLVGLQSKKADRAVAGGQSVDSFQPVGVTLVSDEAISIPQIDITKDKTTGIDTATDVTYKNVQAGEEFVLSYYEFMWLIVREEYGGCCEKDGDEKGLYLAVKTPAYASGKAKLPTPTICAKSGTKSPKEGMIAIDVQGADGKWEIKEEYAEKFGALLRKRSPKRSGGSGTSLPKPVCISQALREILNIK